MATLVEQYEKIAAEMDTDLNEIAGRIFNRDFNSFLEFDGAIEPIRKRTKEIRDENILGDYGQKLWDNFTWTYSLLIMHFYQEVSEMLIEDDFELFEDDEAFSSNVRDIIEMLPEKVLEHLPDDLTDEEKEITMTIELRAVIESLKTHAAALAGRRFKGVTVHSFD